MADEIILVRHGATEWSEHGRHTGRTDLPLTATGRAQAEALRPRVAARDYALVLVSPLQRARETCRLVGLGADAEVDDDLHEWDYGDYEGLTTAEIRRTRPTWVVFDDGAPNGETPEQVAARADRVIARVDAIDGTVALVAHGHLLRVLGARWIGLAPSAGARMHLGTGTLSVLGFEREIKVVQSWNCT
ncbi:MAG TPA: histidine phosphatase family protein [Acidimicrobiia bacterium]|nr:histidine phosphatase family protein [Acidimicrobiia bacterium]